MEATHMASQRKPSTSSKQDSSTCNNGVYEVRIKGHLDEHWMPWFEGMLLSYESTGEPGQENTLITGRVVDQPALHGLLAKIRDLNLTLISVRRIGPEKPDSIEGLK
jgi:hypothetical protein